MTDEILKNLVDLFGENRLKIGEPMNRQTTFRIGGPADYFFEATSVDEIQRAFKAGRDLGLPVFPLGTGANLLVGDGGIRGLVVKISNNNLEIAGPLERKAGTKSSAASAHYQQFDTDQYLKFDDLDLAEPPPDTLVRAGAGVSLPVLIAWTLEQGLTGLQNFAGIPSSVGGAIYNNIHGGTRLFDEFVQEVILMDRLGRPNRISHDEMGFAYDQSRLQETGEIVLEVFLKLSHGDADRARRIRLEWLKRKLKVQPQKDCPGCVFKNISPEEAARIGAPSVAAGWVVDQGLGLKGTKVGGVKISEKHANFFVNFGGATAKDVCKLIDLIKSKAYEKFGLSLVEEIQMVGEF
ncbi:MAG: FAD-binding protein [Patescibacteria group bacterium]|nr:FAD-binding protein [Patescibacteria group bacterium]